MWHESLLLLDNEGEWEMSLQGWRRYGVGAGGMLVVVMAILLTSGMGSAAGAALLNVVVTNDSDHPVPVHEQGTANVNVNGTVPVAPKLPANAFSSFGFEDQTVGPSNLPAGSNWYISEVSGANCSDSPQEVSVVLETSSRAQRGPNLIIPAQDTVDVTFPQPFTLRAGGRQYEV